MLGDTFGWSHAYGNEVVPSPWQATGIPEVAQNPTWSLPSHQVSNHPQWRIAEETALNCGSLCH